MINSKLGKVLVVLMSFLLATFFISFAASMPAVAEKKVTTIRFYHDNEAWQPFWEKISALSAKEIGIALKPIPFGNTETLRMRVRTDLRTSKAPELFKWWFGERARPIVQSGLVEDLSEVWDEVEDYVKPGTRQALTIEGTAYGMPYNVTDWVWFYNKPVFEKYGMKPAETFDEFMDQCEFLQQKGIYPIGNAFGSRWQSIIMPMELLVHTNLDYYRKLRRGEASWTGEPVVRAFKVWKEMLEKDFFPPTDWEGSDIAEAFSKGKVAYIPMGSWFNTYFKGLGISDLEHVGVTMLPAITPEGEGVMIIEACNIMVGRKSPHKKEAKEWLKWWCTSKKAAKLFAEELGLLPWQQVLSEEEIRRASPVFLEIIKVEKDYPKKAIRFWEAFPTPFVEYAVDQFAEMMIHPDKYMEILRNLDKKAEKIW